MDRNLSATAIPILPSRFIIHSRYLCETLKQCAHGLRLSFSAWTVLVIAVWFTRCVPQFCPLAFGSLSFACASTPASIRMLTCAYALLHMPIGARISAARPKWVSSVYCPRSRSKIRYFAGLASVFFLDLPVRSVCSRNTALVVAGIDHYRLSRTPPDQGHVQNGPA